MKKVFCFILICAMIAASSAFAEPDIPANNWSDVEGRAAEIGGHFEEIPGLGVRFWIPDSAMVVDLDTLTDPTDITYINAGYLRVRVILPSGCTLDVGGGMIQDTMEASAHALIDPYVEVHGEEITSYFPFSWNNGFLCNTSKKYNDDNTISTVSVACYCDRGEETVCVSFGYYLDQKLTDEMKELIHIISGSVQKVE